MSAVATPGLSMRPGLPGSGVARPAVGRSRATLYAHVGERLAILTTLLGLQSERKRIDAVYDLMCAQALNLPYGRRPLQASHLNADGTPFQFALALGAGRPALQFLTEPAAPGLFGAQRMVAARRCAVDAAALLGAEASLAAVSPWIDALAPPADAALLAEDAGAIWLGAAFAHGGQARLKVYINAKHGTAASRWARLDAMAARFGVPADWRAAGPAVDRLAPLGVAVIVGPGSAPTARIYLAGYGQALGDHLAFAERFGGFAFRHQVNRAMSTLLEDDAAFPTRSVVASVGLGAEGLADAKIELCAHCAFDDDAQAAARCARLLRQIDIDPAPYLQTLACLSGDAPPAGRAALHAYVGMAAGQGGPRASFYFNPAGGSF